MYKNCFLIYFIFCSSLLHASTVTWIAPSSSNDMEDTSNWNPNTIPGSGDNAVFNSSLTGISTNPTENFAPFSISTLNFPNLASPFHFTFNNQRLAFSGFGVTGSKTNTTLNFFNTNNATALGDMISFASLGTTGSSKITCLNTVSIAGVQSGQVSGVIDSHLHSVGSYIISNGGSITASNSGLDSATALGGNSIAIGTRSQLEFDDSFTSGNNVIIAIENSGTFDGSNSSSSDLVGLIQGHQFSSEGSFEVGDNFSCTVENSGNSSNTGIGGNQIGVINASQIGLQTTAIVGKNASITITNTGISSSDTSVISDETAFLNDNQFFVGETFQADDTFQLTVSNYGNDSSNGVGQGLVSVINSNSGTTGDQVLFLHGGTFDSNASISVTNSGIYTGTNTAGGSQVAGMNQGQFTVGESTSVGSYNFNAGDQFSLTISNSGNDSANGVGGDAVGVVSTNQVAFFTPCSLGNQAQITISNEGHYSGSASTTYVNVGSIGSHQLKAASTFEAGDDFTLQITNSGNNEGSGVGNFYIGDVINGQQADFEDGLTIGNNGSITITNTGSNSGSTTNNNQVGSMTAYGVQLLVKEGFHAGDNLQLTIANSGFDNSPVGGGNFVGFINNNTADFSASQLHLANGGSVGNNASIRLSNTGTSEGGNGGGNVIATLAGPQFASVTDFEAGNQFSLGVSMIGKNNASDQNANSIALLGGSGSSQVDFGSTCTVGNGASFVISNSGINQDASGIDNLIGYITNAQMGIAGDFSAGTDLNIHITNSATNVGDASNFVGYVAKSQLSFEQGCTLHDRTTITVVNSGTVGESQIVFNQGFDIPSGKATIQVANMGEVANHGIEIRGSNEGGNAEIVLSNSSLYIDTSLPNFSIAGLSGDETSIAQSQPTLIINRDRSRQTEFSGAIQDFSGMVPTLLVKKGPGTQILSGTNTYTGLTTIEEGILVVNGSLAGDALIDSSGTLKGSGTIKGAVTNTGTIAPGQSIGTITVGNYFNNGGKYEVEIDGAGQSDLIHALDIAMLNGGSVAVSSLDNIFKFKIPYTILTADTFLTGKFSNVTSLGWTSSILTYDSNHVYLTINPALSKAAETCNQMGVATTLDNLFALNNEQSLLIGTIASLSLENAQQALESLSGFQYTNEVWTTEISTSRFLRRLYDPLRYQIAGCQDPLGNEWATWSEMGYFSNTHGSHAHSSHVSGYQITAGAQRYIVNDFFLGIAGSYEYDHEKFTMAKANRNSGYIGLYGLYRPNRFYTLFDFAYGFTASHLTRTIEAGNLSYTASGHSKVNTFAFYTEFGGDIGIQGFLLQPFIGIQVGKNWRSKVTESNSRGWGLIIDGYQWAPVSSRVGFHLNTCNPCQYIDLSLDVAWDQRLTSCRNSTKGRFKMFGDPYGICGHKLDDTSVDYALTLTKYLGEAFKLYIEFEGQWWRHAHTSGVLAGLKSSW